MQAVLMMVIKATFQSTLPREERLLAAVINASFELFQSTLPREERLNHYAE